MISLAFLFLGLFVVFFMKIGCVIGWIQIQIQPANSRPAASIVLQEALKGHGTPMPAGWAWWVGIVP